MANVSPAAPSLKSVNECDEEIQNIRKNTKTSDKTVNSSKNHADHSNINENEENKNE